MRRFFRVQRLVAATMIVAVVVALTIGLWPVRANVHGNDTYSCGSGFLHSTGDWRRDSTAQLYQRTATNTATGLPATICPDKVDSRRDLALLLMAFSLALGLLSTLFLDRARQPNFGSTMFANRRRGVMRPAIPVRRTTTEDPTVP